MEVTPLISKILEYMSFFDAEIQEREEKERLKVYIQVSDARDLIGEKGITLSCFQHVVRRILAKKNPSLLFVDIDVNGYKQIREKVLHDFAQDIAERVRVQRRSVELEPMPAFDRRIIHLALGNYPDLTTESMGEGEGRYIVVRPLNLS